MIRYPALVLATCWCIAVSLAVVLNPSHSMLGVIAVAAAVPLVGLAFLLRPALIALALATMLLGVGRAELPAVDPTVPIRAAAVAGGTAVVVGRVADDSKPVAGGSEVLVEPNSMLANGTPVAGIGNLLVRWRGPATTAFGDVVSASGKLTLPRDLPAFARRAYLAQREVYLELQASSFNVTAGQSGIGAVPSWLRARFTAALNDALPPPHAAVLLGIVLGIREGIPSQLQNALIATGLIHLLVLSGLKVAVFGRIVQGALNPVLGRHATWPAVGLIALYAMVGGATPAAVRASAMGGLAIAAAHLGRPTHVWTSLSLTAAAMLAWHPDLAWDVGFQLSFAGTAAIILLTPAIARRVDFLPHFLREPFAVTCAAQAGTLPMMATDFHVLSPVAPIANALTLPILPALVVAGLAIGAMSFVPELARFAAIPIAGMLAYVEQVGYVLARVPASAITIPSFPTWMSAAYYAALAPAVAGAASRGNHRKIAWTIGLVGPACISIVALALWANSPPEVVVMNVGDGQAVLLRGQQGTILIDGGPSPVKLKDELGSRLPPWQRKLDAIVITAPGLGHVGGFVDFDRPASQVLVPASSLTGSAWRTAALEAVARGAAVQRVSAGGFERIAGFDVQVLAPEPGAPGDQVGAAYVALRVVAPDGRSFCDFSDLDLDAQTVAAARLPAKCSVLLLPFGGRSRLSSELERAAIDQSTHLVASRGPGRVAIGFPPSVLRTDQEGTIAMPL